MSTPGLRMTYVGGPTALLEFGGLRLLTDPTFDPAGGEYKATGYSLHKTQGPAVPREAIGPLDGVLLSHDHHFDNLDTTGRELLATVSTILTTQAGAARLGPPAEGLVPWQMVEIASDEGRVLRVTATPARHGPPAGDRGPVIGFVLTPADDPKRNVYLSGDTVWYEDLREVGARFSIETAILFMGAARVSVAGPSPLTLTASEGVEAARVFANATIVPVHYEGWQHFTESRAQIERAFADAGLEKRLRWLPPGVATDIGP
jgi:L-ascorbate metabolism protein UlaG (beta-lactamase superfamily)